MMSSNTLRKQKRDMDRIKSAITAQLRAKEEARQRAFRERLRYLAIKKREKMMKTIETAVEGTPYNVSDLTNKQMNQLVHWIPQAQE